MYRLKVQAVDVSGNESGENDYSIDFEIINKATISRLLNYPNPFSTSTRFVFELTGSEIPDELRIDIFTVTGTLVKTIFLDEFGSIRIGKNISEYAWDGKDMYGDQLANGVYFYQVSIKINGKEIELRETEADKYFKKEIGKMYLLR
jgi:flagellar hook assembly protein FlgD